jgi:Putative amidoligase enzyme
MSNLVEFKVSKTIFDDVKNDPGFRIGFEAEFHIQNASLLLRDQTGQIPADFEGYIYDYDENDIQSWNMAAQPTGGFTFGPMSSYPPKWSATSSLEHENTTLYRAGQLFEKFLQLPEGAIDITDPSYKSGYGKWKLTTDPSLYQRGSEHNLGVELISPILGLSEGLAWMAKVLDMIAKFQHGDIRLYTSDRASIHINLSHMLMEYGFDYAKLAIMGGDEHYLADFQRTGNKFAQPILKAVYNELVTAREQGPKVENEQSVLNLLNLRNWSASRVMYDLSTLIPLDHYMSIDFRRLNTSNPYIEIRVAGNTHYEQRYDEIAKMAIRYAALIKIACDPNAYRDEYLKKVYQLVSGAAAPVAEKNPMPRIRIYLQPVMSRASRTAIDQIETYVAAQSTKIPNAPYLVLTILRSAIDMRLAQSLRIREGLKMLLKTMGLNAADLMRALRDAQTLTRYGVMRLGENPGQTIAMLTNAIKQIDQPGQRGQIPASAAAVTTSSLRPS